MTAAFAAQPDQGMLDKMHLRYQVMKRHDPSLSSVVLMINYTLPSSQRRLWVWDLKHHRPWLHTFVAHGQGSGALYAHHFSNQDGSHASSLGFFMTAGVYHGHHGRSIRLRGLDQGLNDHAWRRHLVIHAAWYANPRLLSLAHRLGRSWGCPAVPAADMPKLVRWVADHHLLLIYHQSPILGS